MEQTKGNLAVRFWNSPFTKDTVKLPSGKTYTLLNVPFYYTECIEKIVLAINSLHEN